MISLSRGSSLREVHLPSQASRPDTLLRGPGGAETKLTVINYKWGPEGRPGWLWYTRSKGKAWKILEVSRRPSRAPPPPPRPGRKQLSNHCHLQG